jgi:hypothetical protein
LAAWTATLSGVRFQTLEAFVLAAVLVLVASCGPAGSTSSPAASVPASQPAAGVLPVIISRELTIGPNRIVFSFLDASGTEPVGSPDRTATVQFRGPDGTSVAAPAAEFIWAIENVSGVYVTRADFPVAGAWTAVFTTAAPDSPEESIPFSFDVKEDASVVMPGDKAPSVDTPTLEDVGGDVAKISTDDTPEEAFYETSVADALAAHEPFVLVFATPKFCQTATCGPTLEKVKAVAADHADITFINVEPYKLLLADGQLQPDLSATGQLQAAPATDAYGLLSEPFVFVVGGDGVVKASFELIFTPDEIDEALAGLS